MKIVFCWSELNGYMAACWRQLSEISGISVSIVAGKPGAFTSENKYDREITEGLDVTLLGYDALMRNDGRVVEIVRSKEPEIVFIPGWHFRSFSALAFEKALSNAKFIMGFDTPRTDTLRQRFGWLKIRQLTNRMDMFVVPGERSWQFAVKLLRLPEKKMRRGLYGVDYQTLSAALPKRQSSYEAWPRKFIFFGRQIDVKGFDILVHAYRKYRQLSLNPWPLTCCGTGKLHDLIIGVDGIYDAGFIQPHDMAALLSEHGVFVLPSRHDPWPLALVEAAASGLPILCSNACGSAVEIVRPEYNGLFCATGDAAELAQGLLWMEKNVECLPAMGRRSQVAAEAYSATVWARRWNELMTYLLNTEKNLVEQTCV
jgi:glycosyltransferase involved in cell wall biosynthesis